MLTMRKCRLCGKVKQATRDSNSAFWWCPSINGHYAYCKACARIKMAEYRKTPAGKCAAAKQNAKHPVRTKPEVRKKYEQSVAGKLKSSLRKAKYRVRLLEREIARISSGKACESRR